MKYDLLIKGGNVFDPGQGLMEQLDIAITGEKISAMEKDIPSRDAERAIDVDGRLVTPGLIDLHTHVYWGINDISLDADTIACYSGVTTMVDAGSVNVGSWPGFKRFIVEGSRSRVYCFMNASPFLLGGSRQHPNPIEEPDVTSHVYDTVKTIKENRDVVIGVKILCGYNNEKYPERMLELAIEEAYNAEVPIMVHISFAPPGIEEVLPLLREGDILTHSFTGHTMRIVDRDGRLLPQARDAIDRGVLLDIGHGMGSFCFKVAADLIDQGVLPHTISTDLHSGCVNGPTYDLTTTLSKFWNLGLSLEDVLLRATLNPANIIDGPDGLGRLKVGGVADVAVLEIKRGEFQFTDAHRETINGDKRLEAIHTICRGKLMEEIVHKRYPPYKGQK